MQETRRIEHPFPDNLEGRMVILNAINSELKAVTLLHLGDRAVEPREIKCRIRETVGEGIFLPRTEAFGAYCKKTLVPIGLVSREEIIRDEGDVEVIGYGITPAGKDYGQPIAAFTIEWVARNKQSMYSVLGSTQSPCESRSPERRIRILKELYRAKEIVRETDLERDTGMEEHSLEQHLQSLKTIGFIDFESVGRATGWSRYFLKEPVNVESVAGYTILTQRVYEALETLREANAREIAERIGYIHHNHISTILSGLVNQNAVDVVRWKSRHHRTEIRLAEKGRKFIDEWLNPVEAVLNRNTQIKEELDDRYKQWRESESVTIDTAAALNLYGEISPHINKKARAERHKEIVRHVNEHPGAMATQVSKLLGLSRVVGAHYLREVAKLGIIRGEVDPNDKRMVRYFPAT